MTTPVNEPFDWPLPSNLDEPTEKAVVYTLKLLQSAPHLAQLPALEFLPYFVEAIGLAVTEMLTSLNIWLDDPFKPEEVNEIVGGVALRFLGTGKLADLTREQTALMVTEAIDTYVGKELDKQAKAVISAHMFNQQLRGF